MDLLVALSTSVAYIASVGIMIRDVVQGAGTSRKVGSETTYFDSSVFIIFFILMGRALEGRAKVRVSIQISHGLGTNKCPITDWGRDRASRRHASTSRLTSARHDGKGWR